MAPPPKPTTPPGSDSSTNKANKKKVTPAEVAFLVDRYLADNGFKAALAAFRSDAAHIYSPNRNSSKQSTRGLIPLTDILHDYIALKEARIAIDSAMHAMHSLVSTYYAPSSSTPPTPTVPAPINTNMMMMMMPPLPLPNGAQPSSPPLFVAPHSSSPPSQGTARHASPLIHHYAHASTAVLARNSSSDLSTPAPTTLPTKKRKASKSSGKTTTSASKRSCIAPAATTDAKGKAVPVASQPPNDQNMGSAAQPTSAQHSAMAKLPLQTSSVAKSLFRPLPSPAHSSPYTPQQSNPIQDQPAAYPSATPASAVSNDHAQQNIASSQCSIVSSKTVIVSPLKGGAYYAVERSYHVSSPLKSTTRSSPLKPTTRKLVFDCTEPGPSEQICDKVSTSSDEDKQYDFDINFTNFDIFDGEFSFSELLVDFDLDNEGVQNPSTSAEVQRLETVAERGHMGADPVLPDSVKPMAADSTEDLNSQGATSVTSVRAITKRIKIVSPVKGRTAS